MWQTNCLNKKLKQQIDKQTIKIALNISFLKKVKILNLKSNKKLQIITAINVPKLVKPQT